MREGWKEVNVEDVCNVGDGAHASLKRKDTGVLYLTSKNFDNNGLNLSKIEYISEEDYSKHFKENSKAITKPKFDDILLSIIGSLGSGYIVKKSDKFGLSSSVSILRPNDNIYSKYLFYWLKSDYFQKSIISIKSGVAQSFLSLGMIKKLPVILPPLKTQRKIASILSGYDDLIENNLKRIKILEEMAQQTYEEWFVRMRFPGFETVAMKDGLPMGWEKVKLGEACNLVMGQSPKSEDYNVDGNGLPFHQGVKDYGYRFPINKSWSTSGNKKAIPNSILFSVRAPVGRLNVASEEIILGRGLASINHKNALNSFLYYQLRTIFFEDNLIGGGAIYASVTKTDVERIEIISAGKIAEKFNNYASKIDLEILNLTSQNQRLRESRDILLPRLMMGILDV